MNRARRARIVATLGPASRAPGTVKALAQAGVDVFRLNFSHGSHEDHAAALKAVRGAEMALQRPLGVLADLQGPKLRLGRFKDVEVAVKPGHKMRFDLDPTPGDETRVQMPHPEIFKALRPGMLLLLDDGRVRLRVGDRTDDWADVTVESGTKLSDRKGVAVPDAVIPVSALTPKDREDLAFALRQGVDWVALSFVQKPEDMAELKRIVNGQAACLAKIEKPAAVADLEAILDYCDGVMVARGDLGVELDPEDVPVAQKQIVRAARNRGVPVIVATQMLESMTSAPAPTRAEATDVANAVYEGADALMLSAETLYSAARDGSAPSWLAGQNARGVPSNALWLTSGSVQLFLLITLVSNSTYLSLVNLGTAMILLPYTWAAGYAMKIALRGDGYGVADGRLRQRDAAVSALALLYAVWLVYAGGVKYLLLGALLYAPGAVLYAWARREHGKRVFSRREWWGFAGLLLAAGVGAADFVRFALERAWPCPIERSRP